MAGQELSRFASYRFRCLFVLYAMANLNPPPLFSPMNTEIDAADTGGVIITHGEISCPTVDPEYVVFNST